MHTRDCPRAAESSYRRCGRVGAQELRDRLGRFGLLNRKPWNSSQRAWCRYCLKLGEVFVEGHIKVDGPVYEVFRVATSLATAVSNTTRAGFHLFKSHSRSADRKAIEYHYDVSNDFYRLLLDPGMVYSCAYYRDEADTLEQAQVNKLDHILNKLMVKPGERLLDIGCGWGSLILCAAGRYGAIAHGITTNDADSRWTGLGAGEFIDRYVLPEGELPHISLVQREMALARLEVSDVESLRRHYARTCDAWSHNLEAIRDRGCEIAGGKRYRIWQIYLAGCAYGFANGWMNQYQLLACKSENAGARPLPMTREYMYRR